ncbi:MAG TPA: type II secretion system F family protein [Bacillota bacterium]|nr:type II secretion system F family protein [Bacillota bacterium]
MEKLLFYISCLGFFILLSAGILQGLVGRKQRIVKRIESLRLSSTVSVQVLEEDKSSWKERVLLPLWNRCKEVISNRTTGKRKEHLSRVLAEAGHPFHWSTVDFMLVECGLTAGMFLFFFLLFLPSGKPISALLLSGVASSLGWIYPRLYLKDQKKKRLNKIEKSMPDFFDMVNVSLEAGMGLDAALLKVSKRMNGPLGEGFLRSIEEMKLGKTRKEAFNGLRERIPSELFQSVMSAMIQADQFGIGMTKVIRSQTRRIREQKRQKAREQAMKAPIKMLIPLALFIFPTLFIVILGPMVVKIVTQWL